ncbi:MAG: hypothetical protein KGJ93_00775 [Patescibacteria group bacterium]|nr:hypothetical protein [Patescibacteria group bacterium]
MEHATKAATAALYEDIPLAEAAAEPLGDPSGEGDEEESTTDSGAAKNVQPPLTTTSLGGLEFPPSGGFRPGFQRIV